MNLDWLRRYSYAFTHPLLLEKLRVSRARRLARTSYKNTVSAPDSPKTLYIDVSVVSKSDARTGIQRVVRGIASHLFADTPAGWRVVPVSASRKLPYCPVSWMGVSSESLPRYLDPKTSIFLGLDYSLDAVYFQRAQLAEFRYRGGQLWFLMHDLLPIQHPEWFGDRNIFRFRRWLTLIASIADGVICNSEVTEHDFKIEMVKSYGLYACIQTMVMPMGCDIDNSAPTVGLPDGFQELLQIFKDTPSALMVGTLEPRKGYADVLDACDILWKSSVKFNLVIVGRPGWKTENLQKRIRCHFQFGKQLFWFDDASDEALGLLYQVCRGVIVASLAEGFGLPMVEALGRGKPVLARDIPIFRMKANGLVTYFSLQTTSGELSKIIDSWLSSAVQSDAVSFERGATWKDSAEFIFSSLLQKVPHAKCCAAPLASSKVFFPGKT